MQIALRTEEATLGDIQSNGEDPGIFTYFFPSIPSQTMFALQLSPLPPSLLLLVPTLAKPL